MSYNTSALSFDSPSFYKRLRGMLGVDAYRLLHTPMFYIFLAIGAVIPAMIIGTSGGGTESALMYTNTWQLVASNEPLYVVHNIGEYANMNMVYIFGGIMISIFIGHDYRSGYVKQVFTTHAKKQDYILSKSLSGAFAMVAMCISYLCGTIAGGLFSGASFEVALGGLFLAIISKLLMSLGWASLYAFLNVILRKYFGISIAASFALGTGIAVIGAGALVGNISALNVFLYGASVYACLQSTWLTVLVCGGVSLMWTLIYNSLGSYILKRSDVY